MSTFVDYNQRSCPPSTVLYQLHESFVAIINKASFVAPKPIVRAASKPVFSNYTISEIHYIEDA